MSELPCCKLCEQLPTISKDKAYAMCRNPCDMPMIWLRIDTWRRLMYVPEKIPYAFSDSYGPYEQGWNDYADAMSKGE